MGSVSFNVAFLKGPVMKTALLIVAIFCLLVVGCSTTQPKSELSGPKEMVRMELTTRDPLSHALVLDHIHFLVKQVPTIETVYIDPSTVVLVGPRWILDDFSVGLVNRGHVTKTRLIKTSPTNL